MHRDIAARTAAHAATFRTIHNMLFGALVATITLLLANTAGAAPKASNSAARLPQVTALPSTSGPLLVVVSIRSQRLSLYDKNGLVLASNVSTGKRGYATPEGVFAVIERNREHFSNLYDDAPMPNMQRITWSGVAFHAGDLPGYPASHGCIRLPYNVSAQLFELTRLGTRVVVAKGDVMPVAIEHPRLFSTNAAVLPVAVAAAEVASVGSRIEPLMSPPMRLGAATDSMTEVVLPAIVSDPFADRPTDMTRAAWAKELAARAQASEATAAASKARAAAAAKDADRLMRNVLAVERARSNLAAQVRVLEAAIERGGNRRTMARAVQVKSASETKLLALLAETDRQRAAEAAGREIADDLEREANEAGARRDAATKLAREGSRRLKPISVFVSRQTHRLYVRQGFQPLFDVPVMIDEPTVPIGTHVFTALETTSNAAGMRWSALTTVGLDGAAIEMPAIRNRQDWPANESNPQSLDARVALDRIHIPEAVRERVNALLTPGSSLIVSDEGVSQETGKGTDFVILTN